MSKTVRIGDLIIRIPEPGDADYGLIGPSVSGFGLEWREGWTTLAFVGEKENQAAVNQRKGKGGRQRALSVKHSKEWGIGVACCILQEQEAALAGKQRYRLNLHRLESHMPGFDTSDHFLRDIRKEAARLWAKAVESGTQSTLVNHAQKQLKLAQK